MPTQNWFAPPYDDLIQVPTCNQSGYLATPLCEATIQNIPVAGEKFASCPFHKSINLEPTKIYQVNADCEAAWQLVTTFWFTLPPVMSFTMQGPTLLIKPYPITERTVFQLRRM
ncbi:hypothetical protein [Nonlabens sp.]|uniref:hypothetical protein n=1 Tax=Nonlabens sp. TaxID=1888209 RepID=UPI0025D4D49C|nr:hypothetical protein [Nonlabens sp.]